MESKLDCLTCFCRQALEAARFATPETEVHERVLRKVLRAASEIDFSLTPPRMGRDIHALIRELANDGDPYHSLKKQSNRCALAHLGKCRQRIMEAGDPLEAAVRIAIAGNIIDYAVNPNLTEERILEVVDTALTLPMPGSGLTQLRSAIAGAKSILYLGDNAGEIVFDRLLVEQLPAEKVTYVVKSAPIINDATMEDAQEAGLTGLVEVIKNGDDSPGTILERCSADFRERFEQAGVVIAKGQGNYETLSDAPRPIFFLFMAKCPVIARDVGHPVGTLVLLASQPSEAAHETNDGRRSIQDQEPALLT